MTKAFLSSIPFQKWSSLIIKRLSFNSGNTNSSITFCSPKVRSLNREPTTYRA